jgi:GTP cyclohydrolase I
MLKTTTTENIAIVAKKMYNAEKLGKIGKEKMERLEELYQELLQNIGEDIAREGLRKTPKRAAEAFRYLTRGYRQTLAEIVANAIFQSNSEDMTVVKDIEVYSLCEHHLLPFFGRCHIGYIPNGKMIGVAKLGSIVDMFARRLQLQENLTFQIADALYKCLAAKGVAVVMEARHLCMQMRGAEKQNAVMKTSCMLGICKDNAASKSEFLSLIG